MDLDEGSSDSELEWPVEISDEQLNEMTPEEWNAFYEREAREMRVHLAKRSIEAPKRWSRDDDEDERVTLMVANLLRSNCIALGGFFAGLLVLLVLINVIIWYFTSEPSEVYVAEDSPSIEGELCECNKFVVADSTREMPSV